jgi:hypothetical protein
LLRALLAASTEAGSFNESITTVLVVMPIWQDIPGATSLSYTTPVLAIDDNGAQYRLIVTNAAGSAVSGPALLTVTGNAFAATLVEVVQRAESAATTLPKAARTDDSARFSESLLLKRLWDEVTDTQTGLWVPVVDTQAGLWVPVVDAQAPNWQNIDDDWLD